MMGAIISAGASYNNGQQMNMTVMIVLEMMDSLPEMHERGKKKEKMMRRRMKVGNEGGK